VDVRLRNFRECPPGPWTERVERQVVATPTGVARQPMVSEELESGASGGS
jgi:hypothetical protein